MESDMKQTHIFITEKEITRESLSGVYTYEDDNNMVDEVTVRESGWGWNSLTHLCGIPEKRYNNNRRVIIN
jgi:hypothetical protein